MLSYMDTWRVDYYAKEQEETALTTFHPYYIKNDTGEPNIVYAITAVDSGAERLLQQPRLLERGKEHAIEAMEYEAQVR